MGGNDTITGNGSTPGVSYLNATAAVTVDIAAGTGTATRPATSLGVGIDTLPVSNSCAVRPSMTLCAAATI